MASLLQYLLIDLLIKILQKIHITQTLKQSEDNRSLKGKTGIMAKLLKFILIAAAISLSVQYGAKICFAYDNDNYDLNLQQIPKTYGYLKNTLISPLHFTPSDWNKVGLVALGAGIFYTQDTSIRDYSQNNRTGNSDNAARFFMNFGDGTFTAAILTSLYVYGEFNDDDKYKRAGLLGAESIVVNAILTSSIKLTLQRPLPDSGLPYDTWGGKWNSINDLAFPSGHTSQRLPARQSSRPNSPILLLYLFSLTQLPLLPRFQCWM